MPIDTQFKFQGFLDDDWDTSSVTTNTDALQGPPPPDGSMIDCMRPTEVKISVPCQQRLNQNKCGMPAGVFFKGRYLCSIHAEFEVCTYTDPGDSKKAEFNCAAQFVKTSEAAGCPRHNQKALKTCSRDGCDKRFRKKCSCSLPEENPTNVPVVSSRRHDLTAFRFGDNVSPSPSSYPGHEMTRSDQGYYTPSQYLSPSYSPWDTPEASYVGSDAQTVACDPNVGKFPDHHRDWAGRQCLSPPADTTPSCSPRNTSEASYPGSHNQMGIGLDISGTTFPFNFATVPMNIPSALYEGLGSPMGMGLDNSVTTFHFNDTTYPIIGPNQGPSTWGPNPPQTSYPGTSSAPGDVPEALNGSWDGRMDRTATVSSEIATDATMESYFTNNATYHRIGTNQVSLPWSQNPAQASDPCTSYALGDVPEAWNGSWDGRMDCTATVSSEIPTAATIESFQINYTESQDTERSPYNNYVPHESTSFEVALSTSSNDHYAMSGSLQYPCKGRNM